MYNVWINKMPQCSKAAFKLIIHYLYDILILYILILFFLYLAAENYYKTQR